MLILGTHHVAITTSRFELLREFYVEKLGLPVVDGFPDHDIVFVEAGSTTIELIGEDGPPVQDADDRARRHGWHHLAWEVEDVDDAFDELAARGVPIHSPPESFPETAPTMRIAFLRDPDGNLLELVQPLGARYPTTDVARGVGAV
jgi:catechol 2,3-dioxygenase-like lactoylglutathione lyase family enzyme